MAIEHHKWPSIKDWHSRMTKPWGISINFIEGHEWCSIHWVRVMTALITLLSIQGILTRRWSLLLSQQKNREITEFTTCKRFEFRIVWHIKTRQIKSGNEKSKQSKKNSPNQVGNPLTMSISFDIVNNPLTMSKDIDIVNGFSKGFESSSWY